jgi:hypothetical protein
VQALYGESWGADAEAKADQEDMEILRKERRRGRRLGGTEGVCASRAEQEIGKLAASLSETERRGEERRGGGRG